MEKVNNAHSEQEYTGPVENAGEPEEVFLDERGNPVEPIAEEEDEQIRQEEEALRDRFHRLMADFDNFRRRSINEKAREYQRGRREAAERILPVYDSIAMGLISVGGDEKARLGLEAVQRQLIESFSQIGIEKIPTVGEPFDPEVHEAIASMPSETHPEGVVCEESRAGFADENGLLRAAQVLVSKG